VQDGDSDMFDGLLSGRKPDREMMIRARIEIGHLRDEVQRLKEFVEAHMRDEEEDRKELNKTLESMRKQSWASGVVILLILIQISTGVDLVSWFQGWF